MTTRRDFFKTSIVLSALSVIPGMATESKQHETLKFIHVTDSHMDLSNNDSVEAVKLMSAFINENYKDLDYVLFGGDNFNNNAKGNSDAIKFKEIIDTMHCPSYVVRGNKESFAKPNDGIDLNDFQEIFLKDKDLLVQGKDWKLEKKGYVILGLDSCVEGGNNGLYTKETLTFAKNALKSGKPTVILNHHPYTNHWGGTEEADIHKYVLNNTKEFQAEILSKENVIMTLSGHKHIDSVKELNGTKIVATRGFKRPLDANMYPMRYVEITDGKISEKLIYTS
ncbi:MAG: Icc protein [Sulfurimonas sp.]|jgi:Icc protein